MMPIYIFLLPSCGLKHCSSISSRVAQLDFAGFLLFAGAFTAGIMVVSFGGAMFPWRSGRIIGLFCCSGALWIFFAFQQFWYILTTKENRLFPVKALLSSFDIWLLVGQTASNISILFIALNYIPLYEQFVRSETALHAAVDLLPLVFVTTFFIVFTGSMMGRVGYYMPWYIIGNMFFLVGTALMRTAGLDTPSAPVYGYTILIGVGSGLYVQAAYPVTQAKLVAQEATDAVALIGTTQQGSTAISLTIANSIFINRAADGLRPVLPDIPRSEVQAAIAGVGAQIFQQLSAEKEQQVLEVVLGAIQDVWTQALASAAFAFALSLLMKREKIKLQ